MKRVSPVGNGIPHKCQSIEIIAASPALRSTSEQILDGGTPDVIAKAEILPRQRRTTRAAGFVQSYHPEYGEADLAEMSPSILHGLEISC